MNGTGEGAVGQIDTNKSVAEYKSSVGPDAYHLVVFDAASGSALASVYDKNTELIEHTWRIRASGTRGNLLCPNAVPDVRCGVR